MAMADALLGFEAARATDLPQHAPVLAVGQPALAAPQKLRHVAALQRLRARPRGVLHGARRRGVR